VKETIRRNPVVRVGLIAGLVKNIRLALRLLRDARVSHGIKLLIPGLALGYLLFPADLLPDFVPVLGQLDDAALLAVGLKFFIDMCPPGIVKQHLAELEGRGRTRSRETGPVVEGDYRVIE
jgi:uncharacterized membrane protein YkvA (DUF1232 family)